VPIGWIFRPVVYKGNVSSMRVSACWSEFPIKLLSSISRPPDKQDKSLNM